MQGLSDYASDFGVYPTTKGSHQMDLGVSRSTYVHARTRFCPEYNRSRCEFWKGHSDHSVMDSLKESQTACQRHTGGYRSADMWRHWRWGLHSVTMSTSIAVARRSEQWPY